MARKTVLERFEEKHEAVTESGCWLWLDSLDDDGYGKFRLDALVRPKAHRVAWLLYCGEIPDGLCVLHKCDTPQCVNPAHLFLGTRRDNSEDRDRKGRNINYRGEQHASSKPGEQQVREIRARYEIARVRGITGHDGYGRGLVGNLAAEYGIKQSTVYQILSRKSWSHIP